MFVMFGQFGSREGSACPEVLSSGVLAVICSVFFLFGSNHLVAFSPFAAFHVFVDYCLRRKRRSCRATNPEQHLCQPGYFPGLEHVFGVLFSARSRNEAGCLTGKHRLAQTLFFETT